VQRHAESPSRTKELGKSEAEHRARFISTASTPIDPFNTKDERWFRWFQHRRARDAIVTRERLVGVSAVTVVANRE
jgi:hypothetical protein